MDYDACHSKIEIPDILSLNNSCTTVETMGRRHSADSLEEFQDIEERILTYLTSKNILFFTDPQHKEEVYNKEQHQKMFPKLRHLASPKFSSLLRKRTILVQE